MKGPFHYFEEKVRQQNTLDKVLQSDDRRNLQSVRSVTMLSTVMFAAFGIMVARDAIDIESSALTQEDSIVFQAVDSIAPTGEIVLAGVAGWASLEMAGYHGSDKTNPGAYS